MKIGEVRKNLLLVPDVVAGSQDGDAQAEQLLDQRRRDPKAGSGVFPIRQNQVRGILLHQPRQNFLDRAAARLTEDVANKENLAGHKAPEAGAPLRSVRLASCRAQLGADSLAAG